MVSFHQYLCRLSRTYHRWHKHPYHSHTHWGVTFVIAIAASVIIIASGFRGPETISPPAAVAAPVSVFVPFAASVMQRHVNDVYTPYNPWDWDLATMLFGLWRAYEVTGDTAYRDHIKWYLDQFIKRDGGGNVYFDYRTGVPEGPNELATFYLAALLSEEGVPDAQKYEIAARNAVNHAINNWGRTSNGGFDHRFDISNGHELWLDTLFMVGPALAKMGQIDGNNTYFNEAANQFIYHLNVNGGSFLQDNASGLLYHGWDAEGDADWMWLNGASNPSTEYWGRGNGWVAAAFAEVLSYLPAGHSRRPELLNRYRSFLNSLAGAQGPNGLWYTLMDFEEPGKTPADGNYEESSGSALITYSFLKAKQAHLLEEMGFANNHFDSVISSAVSGLVSRVVDIGGGEIVLNGASEGTNPGNVEYYLNRNQIQNRLWGDGAALMALSLSDTSFPPPSPACSDGTDNDSDGLIDYPADPGCTSATDTSETNTPPPPPPSSVPSLLRPAGNEYTLDFDYPVARVVPGDFNRDGVLDFVMKSEATGAGNTYMVQAKLNDGTGGWEFNTNITPPDAYSPHEIPLLSWDFNNDELWEVYFIYNNGGIWRHRIVRGDTGVVLADAEMPRQWNLDAVNWEKSMAAIAHRNGIPRIVVNLDYKWVWMFDTYTGSSFALNEMWEYAGPDEYTKRTPHDMIRTADVDQDGSDDEILLGCGVLNSDGSERYHFTNITGDSCGGTDQILLGYFSPDRPNELVMVSGDSESGGKHVVAFWARTGELMWSYRMPDLFSNGVWRHFHSGFLKNEPTGAKILAVDRDPWQGTYPSPYHNWAYIDVPSGSILASDVTIESPNYPSCPGYTIDWNGDGYDECPGTNYVLGRVDLGDGGCEEGLNASGNTFTVSFNANCPATAVSRWEASRQYRLDVGLLASGYASRWLGAVSFGGNPTGQIGDNQRPNRPTLTYCPGGICTSAAF